MGCVFCSEGDRWIKTCRALDGSRLRVCDPCWEVLSPWLVVVPGDGVVSVHCDLCGAYFNPRVMADVSPGGRKDAYLGTCGACAQVGASGPAGAIRPDDLDGLGTLGGVRHNVGGPSKSSGRLAVPDGEE